MCGILWPSIAFSNFHPKFLQKNAHELMIVELHSCDLTPLRRCEAPSGASFRTTDGEDSCFVGVKDQGTPKQLLYRAVLEKHPGQKTTTTFFERYQKMGFCCFSLCTWWMEAKKNEQQKYFKKKHLQLIKHSQLGLCKKWQIKLKIYFCQPFYPQIFKWPMATRVPRPALQPLKAHRVPPETPSELLHHHL